MNFDSLGLTGPILAALAAEGFTTPTPIQTQAIPVVLEGRDVVGLAQTGTGKTAAFALPLLQRLMATKKPRQPKHPRVLILSPTRELASQIHKAIVAMSRKLPVKTASITGGVSIRTQIRTLAQGVDILVATPGRLIDLAEQKAVCLDTVEALVLDEADHMLDIGFMPAIRRILAMLPAKRQTMLFSATMPREIRQLSQQHLHRPAEISVAPAATTAEKVDQKVVHLTTPEKVAATASLMRSHGARQAIIFVRTKRGADRLAKQLAADGIEALAIHGNKSQGQRERALGAFRKGTCPALIATDIAARGIDIPDLGLVINFDLPNVAETYVHRIGRTARAGATGMAVSLCAPEDRACLRDIERLIRQPIAILDVPGLTPLARPVQLATAGKPRPKANANAKPNGKPNAVAGRQAAGDKELRPRRQQRRRRRFNAKRAA